MRVTNSLFYTNATNDYQRNMQELYKSNQQISSGLKIQNSFEDSGVYVDAMRLNYEVSTLEQVKDSSSKAQTYANNTDQVLNQFTDSLTQFKTKLLQGANESNSTTSLNALANELEALLEHMVSLGNTSINGQYLFSGTDVTTKPVSDDGTYNGNDGDIEAIIGSGVKLPYNITGKDLFLGQDNEYNKVLSTNVKMYNQTLLHPADKNEASKEVFITQSDTIGDLTGDSKIEVTAYDIAGAVEPGDIYSIQIDGQSVLHTVTNETTSEEITTALMNAINDPVNDVNTIVKATTDGSKLILTSIDPTLKPTIVTDVTNIANSQTSASITNAISETVATAHVERTSFNATSWNDTADSITWDDGLGNNITLNSGDLADGANEDVIGAALAAAINADLTTGALYTANYDVPTKKLLVTANTLGSASAFDGTITSVSSSVPATYSSAITNNGAAISTSDMITWTDNATPTSTTYTYTATASDSTVDDMLIGLTAKIDTAGVYNASYDLAGGFAVESNTSEFVAGFNGALTMDTGPAIIFGALEVSDPGETVLVTVKDPVISGVNGTPSSSTVTFNSTTTGIDAGDIFSFTIDDGASPAQTFSYTSVADDTLANVLSQIQSQLDSNTVLYGGNGVDASGTIDEGNGTLSFEITGNYPPGTLFDGTGVITIDSANTTDTDTDLQTITKDSVISLSNGEAIASFYISGRNSEGDTFSKELQLSVSSKVEDLLEEIGQAYGNTSTNKVVEVSMNDHGQIEIKDLSKGNSLLEFNIFGAIDRNAVGTVGNASQTDVDDLLAQNNVDIIDFNKSNFLNTNTASSIASKQDINNPGIFKLGAPLSFSDGTPVEETTTLKSFMGDEVNQIQFSGTNNSGVTVAPVAPNDVLKIDNSTTVEDLLTTLESIYGVPARLENGQIILEGDETIDFAKNELKVTIDALKGAGESEVQSIDITSGASSSGTIEITLAGATTHDIAIPLGTETPEEIATLIANELSANIPFAVPDDNIVSVRADGSRVVVDYDIAAEDVVGTISISDSGVTGISNDIAIVDETYTAPNIAEVQSFEIKDNYSTGGNITVAGQNIAVLSTDTPSDIATKIAASLGTVLDIDSVSVNGGEVTINYALAAGDVGAIDIVGLTGVNIAEVVTEENFSLATSVDVFSTYDTMNYERRGFEKDGNLLSGNISQRVISTGEYASGDTKLSEVAGTSLNGEQLILKGVTAKSPYSSFTAQIDFGNPSTTFSINGGENNFTIFNGDGGPTAANEMTYQQLNDVISMITAGVVYPDVDEYEFDSQGNNLGQNGTLFDEYNDALTIAKSIVEVGLDYKGQLEIHDKKDSESKIEFSIYDNNADDPSSASALSFMANDAVTIDEPKIDFYKNLEDMIDSVRNGTYRMDSESDDPRNIGIQNSISKIDHIMDHVTKEHTKIGSYSNALSQASARASLLSVNIQTVRSEVIDVDIGEAYMKFNQLANSYQAMLSTVAKINSMTLLNYM